VSHSTDSRLRSAVRRFTLGSGPLKRRSDRLQMSARLLVVLAFLVAPPLAVLAATKTTAHLEALAAAQAAERQRVLGVILADASGSTEAPGTRAAAAELPESATQILVRTRVRWTTPAGETREGVVLVPPGTPADTPFPVWVDRDGDLTRAPLDPDGIPGTATTMALLPLLGVPIVTWTCYAVLCVALDARRDRRWTDGWTAVEPRWRAQLP
jgi:hypothetical protein